MHQQRKQLRLDPLSKGGSVPRNAGESILNAATNPTTPNRLSLLQKKRGPEGHVAAKVGQAGKADLEVDGTQSSFA